MPFDLTPPNPDPVVAVVCAIGAVSGVWKGASWVVLRLVALVAAIVLALMWNAPVGTWLAERVSFVPGPPAANWIAGFGILVAVFLLGTFVAHMARGAIRRVKLGGLDRMLGLVLGTVLGLVLVTALYLAWGKMTSPERLKPAFQNSVTAPWMSALVEVVSPLLPEDIEKNWRDVMESLPDPVELPVEIEKEE